MIGASGQATWAERLAIGVSRLVTWAKRLAIGVGRLVTWVSRLAIGVSRLAIGVGQVTIRGDRISAQSRPTGKVESLIWDRSRPIGDRGGPSDNLGSLIWDRSELSGAKGCPICARSRAAGGVGRPELALGERSKCCGWLSWEKRREPAHPFWTDWLPFYSDAQGA